jgi:hypothetical protein
VEKWAGGWMDGRKANTRIKPGNGSGKCNKYLFLVVAVATCGKYTNRMLGGFLLTQVVEYGRRFIAASYPRWTNPYPPLYRRM